MKLFPVVCVITALALGQAAKTTTTTQTSTAKSTAGRTIEFVTGDNMKFDKTEITARPGETLRIVVKNTGAMPKLAMAHNFVLLKPGTDQVEFNTAAFSARDTDFIPPAMKAAVIANTALAGAGETVEVTFKAPAAGTYNFLCSFPGHFALGMRGTLTVK
jgi:azurin